jgi:hypothetical protein
MLARLYEAVFIRNYLNLNQMLESVLMMLSLSRSIFFYLSHKRIVQLDHPNYLPDWFFTNFGYFQN